MINRKGQAFVAIISILFVIFVVAFVVYISSIPKQDSSNINTIILNNSNYTNQSVQIQPIQINVTNVTNSISKPKENYTLYPDRRLVKGSILTTNKSIICVSGYSDTVRNVPVRVRKHVFYRDGVGYPPNKSSDYELDHFKNLCLGGGNTEDNLWVMSAPYYKWKDDVEVLVCRKLCSTNMTVETAGDLMWIWYDIYKNNSIVDDYINE